MIYLPIEIQLKMIREDLEEIKSLLKPNYPYTHDPIYGRMLYGCLSPPEMGEGSILLKGMKIEFE